MSCYIIIKEEKDEKPKTIINSFDELYDYDPQTLFRTSDRFFMLIKYDSENRTDTQELLLLDLRTFTTFSKRECEEDYYIFPIEAVDEGVTLSIKISQG
jgi:hypothetical protein